ncbi:MAG: hypothetical protein JKY54_09835 [Flavobacteriales bacterium]|nr:hypothetical protein [Flavobacteriales bacterium]
MRLAVIILFSIFAFHSAAQRIPQCSDFNGFDTLNVLKTWQYSKEYYSKDTIRYEVRYKLWGKGCLVGVSSVKPKKCKFYIQEQLWRKDGSLEWKHGIWGHRSGKQVNEQQLFVWYSQWGKVAQKTKKKKSYLIE